MIELDVNVLINAARTEASDHDRYREWLLRIARGREEFGISELALSSFLGIMTSPAVVGPGVDPQSAYRFADRLTSRRSCVLVRPGPRTWGIFRRLCSETGARGKVIPDAYLAATAIEWSHEWISDDADFARFPGLRWRRPFD